MLQIRLICCQCGNVTYITPAISDELIEDIACANCKANICSLIRTKD